MCNCGKKANPVLKTVPSAPRRGNTPIVNPGQAPENLPEAEPQMIVIPKTKISSREYAAAEYQKRLQAMNWMPRSSLS